MFAAIEALTPMDVASCFDAGYRGCLSGVVISSPSRLTRPAAQSMQVRALTRKSRVMIDKADTATGGTVAGERAHPRSTGRSLHRIDRGKAGILAADDLLGDRGDRSSVENGD